MVHSNYIIILITLSILIVIQVLHFIKYCFKYKKPIKKIRSKLIENVDLIRSKLIEQDQIRSKLIEQDQIRSKLIYLNNYLIDTSKNCDFGVKLKYPIYYINLDNSIQRRKNMENQFKQYNIRNTTKIKGVLGNTLKCKLNVQEKIDDNLSFYYNTKFNKKKMNKNEIGCTLSHIKAIKTAYDNGDMISIICEDDISFLLLSFSRIESVDDVIKSTYNDWEIISLSSVTGSNNEPLTKKYIEYTTINFFCSSAYLISRKGMKSLLDKFIINNVIVLDEKYHINYDFRADYMIFVNLKSYVVYPQLIYQLNDLNDPHSSTIHKSHTLKHNNDSITVINKHISKHRNYDECRVILDNNLIKTINTYIKTSINPIPKIIHQIWLRDDIPYNHMDTFRVNFTIYYPEWTYMLWTKEDIIKLNLYNNILFNRSTELTEKVNILKYEILYKYGGIYIDNDIIWFNNDNNFNSLIDIDNSFFIGRCIDDIDPCLSNSIVGCSKNNIFTKIIIEEIKKILENDIYNNVDIDKKIGSYFIDQITRSINITIYPSYYFYPYEENIINSYTYKIKNVNNK